MQHRGYFHPLSSTIHFHPLSSTFIHFYPHSSTCVHFLSLLFTFIQKLPPGVTYKRDWMGLGWMDGWTSDCQSALLINIVSVLHQNKGCIRKSIPVAQEISGDKKDFLIVPGFGFPNSFKVLGGLRTFTSSLIHPKGWIRKSIPLGQLGLTVLKSILPSLLMMREFPTG